MYVCMYLYVYICGSLHHVPLDPHNGTVRTHIYIYMILQYYILFVPVAFSLTPSPAPSIPYNHGERGAMQPCDLENNRLRPGRQSSILGVETGLINVLALMMRMEIMI